MKHPSALLLLSIPLTLSAATTSENYQDGVLTKVRSVVVGNSCSSAPQSDAATYGNTAHPTIVKSARCYDLHGAIYTVQVGGAEYELTPDHSRAARASAFLPLSGAFLKESSLANHLPGTAVKFRSDTEGIFVLVDKRESHYRMFVTH